MTYEFADPGVIVHEDISFGLNISDGSTVVGHSFIRRVSIRSTTKTLNDFPHVWIIGIGHCVLEKIFPTFCLGLVDSLGSFMTSASPLMAILMDRSTEAILSVDFSSHMKVIQDLDFLLGFDFPT